MKSFKVILLFLFIGTDFCRGQDTTVLLSPAMFDKTRDQIFICTMDGWLYKDGHDTAWAKKDIDISSWKKLKPTELSAKQADKNGKVEGWFRIKIKLDSAFENKPLGFQITTWAALDFYINENLIKSFGNTGQNEKPFREFRSYGESPLPFNLKPGNEYTLALHFVDYLAPLPPVQLKSEDIGLRSLIRITGPKYNSITLRVVKEITIYSTIWIAVFTVLTFLFWLLSFQNPNEKNLLLIAFCSTFYALNVFCITASRSTIGISYVSSKLFDYASSLFGALSTIIVPLILANIFKRKVTRALKIFLILYFIATISNVFLQVTALFIFSLCTLLAVCIYYIVSSWKKLKGAQWSIVAGLLFTLLSALIYFFMAAKYNAPFFPYAYLYLTGIYISFPLSLLVYVAIRFKEIIKEVQQNAKQVLQLSEEKKERAINQQKILQEEVNRQTAEIRTTLNNLKSTQAQLIQSEKMASLGELTAGIAHEIQNPLNFVNNFSEVSNELIGEMVAEVDRGNSNEVKVIANDIKQNLEKINHHGKRADAIVKGMLQHSRISSGIKEPTNINALADEYLRLAYHGLRAKDKSFNATMKTDFDESIGNINIVPQDIGRAVLNLITNAFYAVSEKKKQNPNGYEPTVSVSTKKTNGKIEIKVSDNGNGIPQRVLDKIFQPFFTTKPTGQGTGLGLSLSYDIIKVHGGEIKVNTKEGEFTEFVVQLPISA